MRRLTEQSDKSDGATFVCLNQYFRQNADFGRPFIHGSKFLSLILYRWMLFSLRPERFTPDHWIDLGGLAITALAGALLIKVGPHWALLQTLAPFLIGLAVCFWSAATWRIPLQVTCGYQVGAALTTNGTVEFLSTENLYRLSAFGSRTLFYRQGIARICFEVI